MDKKAVFLCSNKSSNDSGSFRTGRWSTEEHERFLKGCYYFKDDWQQVSYYIKIGGKLY